MTFREEYFAFRQKPSIVRHLFVSTIGKNVGKSGRRILVVDDEPSVCRAIKMLLEIDGHEVCVADGARAALDLFEAGTFDLVITDYSMPDMKGDEFSILIKERRPAQRILMITAFGGELKASGKLNGVVDALIDKPFSFTDLRAATARVLAD
jgi:CheY-like chemotaxis protein